MKHNYLYDVKVLTGTGEVDYGFYYLDTYSYALRLARRALTLEYPESVIVRSDGKEMRRLRWPEDASKVGYSSNSLWSLSSEELADLAERANLERALYPTSGDLAEDRIWRRLELGNS